MPTPFPSSVPAPRRLARSGAPAVLATGLVTGLIAGLVPGLATAPATAADAPRRIAYRSWDSTAQLRTGTLTGVRVVSGKLTLGTPARRTTIGGRRYAVGQWVSPSVRPGFGLTELVPSWTATTPAGTLVQVEARGVTLGGKRSSWDNLGRWTSGDAGSRRTSFGRQGDDSAHVATDTWRASYGAFRSWQLRVTLLRRTDKTTGPRVGTVGAMVSALPDVDDVTTSEPGVARGRVLDVPRYSQMIHQGEYPKYGGGGEAWCSPTSTAMVLGYYRRLPSPSAYAWVDKSYADRVVDHAARATYDVGYGGTGNWPFNTAWAGKRAGHAFVTRFGSLRGVERFIKAGIPVVTSITFGKGRLRGAPISASNGHLLVVVGFTKSGDVVVNDPAAKTWAGVRRTYARGQFEDAWLQRYPQGSGMRGSGGLAYVIRDGRHPLPARGSNKNW